MIGAGLSPCPVLGLGIALLHGGWEWGWLRQNAASADTRSPRVERTAEWGGGLHSLPNRVSTQASHTQHLGPRLLYSGPKNLVEQNKANHTKGGSTGSSQAPSTLGPQINNRRTGENFPWEVQKEGSLSEAPRHLSLSRSLGLPQRHAPTHLMHRPNLPVRENLVSFSWMGPEHTQTHHPGGGPSKPTQA